MSLSPSSAGSYTGTDYAVVADISAQDHTHVTGIQDDPLHAYLDGVGQMYDPPALADLLDEQDQALHPDADTHIQDTLPDPSDDSAIDVDIDIDHASLMQQDEHH